MKKIYSLILAFAILCMSLPIAFAEGETEETTVSEPAVISAFSEIPAESVSELNSLKLDNNNSIGDTYNGSWARFDNIDFGLNGISALEINIGVPDNYAGRKITFHIDDVMSAAIAEITISKTGGWTNYVWQSAEVSGKEIAGVHSLYLRYYGTGTGNLKAIRMTELSIDTGIPSDIDGTGAEEDFEILEALGIIEWDGSSAFGIDEKVTAEEFVKTALKLKGGSDSEAEMILKVCELEAGAEITNEGASRIITVLLKRQNVKKAEETFYHHLTAFTDIRFSGAASDTLTRLGMIKLLYDTTEAEIMEARGIEYDEGGAYVEYAARKDNTLLSHYRDIYTEEGVVTMDYLTGIDSISGLKKDQLLIDGYLFTLGECSSVDLLGYKVKFYYIQSDDENTLLYVKKVKKANNIIINSDDIISYSNHTITYEDENGSTKRESIPKSAKIIYNGLAAPSYSASMFDIENGSVEIIYSDGRDVDCVKINSSKNYQVAKFSDDVIYFQNTDFKIDLEASGMEYDLIDKYGDPVETKLLTKDTVCTVSEAVDMNGNFKYYCIRVSRKYISGAIQSMDGSERTIEVGGAVYECGYSVTDELYNSLSAGIAVKLCLDVYGKIAFITSGNSKEAIGYIVNCYYDDTDESVIFRIFDEDGEMIVAKCGEYVNINGTRYTDDQALGVAKPGGVIRNELVVFYVNALNKLTKLNFAEENGAGDDNTGLYKYLEGSKQYKRDTGSFGGEAILSADFKLFSVPENKAAYEDYMIQDRNSIADDETLELICYNRLQNKLDTTYGVREYNPVSSGYISPTQDISYVADIRRAINAEDEVGYQIDYYNGVGKTLMTKFVSSGSEDTAKQLKVGDGIRFATNSNDEIIGLTRIFSVSENEIYSGSQTFNARTQVISGTVYKTDNYLLKFENNGEIINYSTAVVYIYDSERDELSLGSVDDVLDYISAGANAHFAFVYAQYSRVRSMVLIK